MQPASISPVKKTCWLISFARALTPDHGLGGRTSSPRKGRVVSENLDPGSDERSAKDHAAAACETRASGRGRLPRPSGKSVRQDQEQESMMRKRTLLLMTLFAPLLWRGETAQAHGPLFSPAPETIFKGGTELTLGTGIEDGTRTTNYAVSLEATYGITANWEVGIEIPHTWRSRTGEENVNGIGNLVVQTKYQFWKRDLSGAQYKSSALIKINMPTSSKSQRMSPDGNSTDITLGLVAGYESRRWYWFASGVYRINGRYTQGRARGDRQFLSLVGGIRPFLTAYRKPDTVLMLELNWERTSRDRGNFTQLTEAQGWRLFLSPVVWWTYRQFAIRAGIQVPVAQHLREKALAVDYRARIEAVYHF